MNKEKLFGLETGFISTNFIQILKNFIFLKYGLYEYTPLKLTSVPLSILPEVGMITSDGKGTNVGKGLISGTVRMGYGHHRMAYAIYTWSVAKKINTYLHDILAFNCNESVAIKDIDGLYSQMSRASSEMGGMIEWLWGQITSGGGIGSLQFSVELSERYVNLLNDIPRTNPYISSYPLNGQIAVASGFEKVVHLIPDNYPQHYLLVPGAMNLVQSPASYIKFIEMGVPKENLHVAGHWVSHKIAANAIEHSNYRNERAAKKFRKRILLAIGGAGAQRNYTLELLEKLKEKLLAKKIFLWINTGDHKKISEDIKLKLTQLEIPFDDISGREALLKFTSQRELSNLNEIEGNSVSVFHFENYFEAFTATDELICVSDILMTKPSELAFFPIPKIFIRRVGDHEAASAFRSMELGEGTMECREPHHALEMIKLFSDAEGIFVRMNECIIRNSREGIYDGARVAVEMANS
ncbi:MAG: hypothetical protein SFU98_18725 [Leptospiraceae bacterium]|nr:hypothetical protein [Leptospiraceae bacterium]